MQKLITLVRGRKKYSALEKAIQYSFKDKKLLEAALTHPSYKFEHADVDEDNQRIEFLGDAVLAFITGELLYKKFRDRDEGWLTSLRTQIISGQALGDAAARISLGTHLRLGRGEENSGGRRRSSILADALEALLGAVYLDGGIKAVHKVFKSVFGELVETLKVEKWAGNPKGRLQEYAQRNMKLSPRYHMLRTEGPQHSIKFFAEVRIGDTLRETGSGASKKEAEMMAASKMLARLEDISE